MTDMGYQGPLAPAAYMVDGFRVSLEDIGQINGVLRYLGEEPLTKFSSGRQRGPGGYFEYLDSYSTDGRPKARELLKQIVEPRLHRMEERKERARQEKIANLQTQIEELQSQIEQLRQMGTVGAETPLKGVRL